MIQTSKGDTNSGESGGNASPPVGSRGEAPVEGLGKKVSGFVKGVFHGENAECEPITGVWGGAAAGSSGRAPGQGFRGAKPPEAESLLAF